MMNRSVVALLIVSTLAIVAGPSLMVVDVADADVPYSVDVYHGDQRFDGSIIGTSSLQIDTVSQTEGTKYIIRGGSPIQEYDDLVLRINPAGSSGFSLKVELIYAGDDPSVMGFIDTTGVVFGLTSGDSETRSVMVTKDSPGTILGSLSSGVDYKISVSVPFNPEIEGGNWIFDETPLPVMDTGFRITVTNPDYVKVSFDANKGSVSADPVLVEVGERYGDLPTPSRSGYVFDGWYTFTTGGVRITSDTIVTIADDHTLYAHWSYIPTPTPDPKPEPPTPSEPEHSESIGEDGSKTESEKETTVDGDRITTIEKETNTKTDGSSIVTESKTVTEKTETGTESMTESTSTSKDSQGNITSVTETSTKVTVDGDTVTTITDSVVRDPQGNVISEDRSESTEVSKGEGVKESSSSTTTVTSEGTVMKETVSQIVDNDGHLTTSSVTSEIHTDNDGNTVKIITTESLAEETVVSGGKVTKIDSTVITKDADGNILTNDKVSEERSITVSGKETITSSNIVTESRDTDNELISITETVSETRQSPGSDIITDFNEKVTTPDGQTKVSEGISSTTGDYSITTVAVTITENGNSSSNAKTTLNYLGTAVLDAPDVDLAYGHSVKTTSSMGVDDVERNVRVTSGNGVSAVATSVAFGKMSSLSMGLYIEGSVGSLRYDPDACGSFASSGKDVTITMLKDAVDVLTEAQKEVVGKTGFVSVSAYAGSEYVTDLGGTVTISFSFDMGQGSFAAYYVADDGSTEKVSFTYDRQSGMVSMKSGHHSIYAMLPVEEPVPEGGSSDNTVPIVISIIVVLVIVAAVALVRRS